MEQSSSSNEDDSEDAADINEVDDDAVMQPGLRPKSMVSAAGSDSAESGFRQYAAVDSMTGLQTLWQVGATRTDAGTGRQYTLKRVQATSKGRDDRQDSNKGDTSGNYGGRHKPSNAPLPDYQPGKVIEFTFVPLPQDHFSNTSVVTPIQDYSAGTRLRRFVIIEKATAQHGFKALPIKTYNGRGVAAYGVVKKHHAIIHSRSPPYSSPDEAPRRLEGGAYEDGMRHQPIMVRSFDRTQPLDPMARLDFLAVQEFATDVENVTLYGEVTSESLGPLHYQYRAVWAAVVQATSQRFGQQGIVALEKVSAPLERPFVPQPWGNTATFVPLPSQAGRLAPRPPGGEQSTPNPGPMTVEVLTATFATLVAYARRNGYPVPQSPTEREMAALAQDGRRRDLWFASIRRSWGQDRGD
ncbi:hypothetical protein LTR17_003575 [Elasticomyces elasticus]|nr:hypothetical protein LTR17_003575 [Elasticomyces elasticus]